MWFARMNYQGFVISIFIIVAVPAVYAAQPPLTSAAQSTGESAVSIESALAPVVAESPVASAISGPSIVQPEAQTVAAPVMPSGVQSEQGATQVEKSASIPAAPVVAATTQQESDLGDEATIIGIDTVELQDAQGNWLFKRMWWERSEDKYEKIRKQVASIMESRGQFFDKRSNAEKNIFDYVYQQTGFERGELEALINRLIDLMNKFREREGSFDEKEREFYAQLQTEKKDLEALKTNANTINVLENSVDDVLAKLMETINRVREYEQDAWQNFKDIARVLDDRKAKEMFYKIDAIWRNVTSLKEYIQTRLSAHFDQLLSKSKEEADLLAKKIQELKDKGHDLQKQEEAILQYTREKEEAKIRAAEQARLDDQQAAKELEKEEEGFFTSYIWNPIKAVITWPYYVIFGSDQEEEMADEEPIPVQEPTKTKEDVAKLNTQSTAVPEQKKQSLDQSQLKKDTENENEDETEGESAFVTYILNPLKSVWHAIVYIVTWPYFAIVGTSENEQLEEVVPEPSSKPVESTTSSSAAQGTMTSPTEAQPEVTQDTQVTQPIQEPVVASQTEPEIVMPLSVTPQQEGASSNVQTVDGKPSLEQQQPQQVLPQTQAQPVAKPAAAPQLISEQEVGSAGQQVSPASEASPVVNFAPAESR